MEKQIEAEMLEIIEKSREEWSHDVTDHTENEYIREGLLNAGYRKQEWIGVEERLPETSGYYYGHLRTGLCDVYHYSAKHKAFNAHDSLDHCDYAISVTHWMPLPEPPKGDKT